MNIKWLLLPFALSLALSSHAADKVKIGYISTLSGPLSSLGIEIRDGFNLALKETGNKIGGLPAEVVEGDDQASADVGKQLADKFLKRDKVDFMTGVVYSNVLLAIAPPTFAAKTFYISTAAGPASLAGAQCNPYFFGLSWQNDGQAEAMGKYMSDKGYKKAYILAPNYAGGRENLAGFKRTFKGEISAETYVKMGELDFASEISQIRANKPDALFFFLPGAMGVNFIKQLIASGLDKQVPYFVPGYSADEDTIRALGDSMVGLYNSSHWASDLDNPANKKFVADFKAAYNRVPSMYAFQGYDAVRLLDRAVADVKGNIEDKAALRDAIAAARFQSARGEFRFNTNQFPINSFYLRQVQKNASGVVTNKTIAKITDAHSDTYVGACRMKAI
jgi:branched-chain amino acid transport system substrate-binding protein